MSQAKMPTSRPPGKKSDRIDPFDSPTFRKSMNNQCLVIRRLRFLFGYVLTMLLFSTLNCHAHESIFSWTYTTDLTPKGHSEIEQWVTWRHGKQAGDFDILDFREEIEYGVTDNFQAALYLNHAYH